MIRKVMTLGIIISLLVSSLYGKEWNIFPGIGSLDEIRGKTNFQTIEGKVFYNPNIDEYKGRTNLLLLQKYMDYNLESS